MEIAPEIHERIQKAKLERVSLDNPLLQGLPSWLNELRPHQVTAIQEIRDAFKRTNVVVLQAPTGSGKSVIAEATRRLLQSPKSLYLCSTKFLQDQIEETFPYIPVLKGRNNYIPQYPVEGVTCSDCTYRKDTQECFFCDSKRACPYTSAKEYALHSSICCLNTAYFVTEVNTVQRFDNYPFVILDEADVFEHQLMSTVEVDISSLRMKRYGWQVPEHVTKPESWISWIKSVQPKVNDHIEKVEFKKDIKSIREMKYLEDLKERLNRILNDIIDDPNTWIYTGNTRKEDKKRVAFKPINVAPFGRRLFWNHAQKYLLMSATPINVRDLGYTGEYETINVPSTFPKENRPIYVIPAANMTHKTTDEELPKLINKVKEIIEHHPTDRILIHTVSYYLTEKIYHALKVFSNRPRYTYDSSETRLAALEGYKNSPNAILVAPSFERGVDLPGDLCRVQVIAKIPFPSLGDRQIAARLHSGGSLWYSLQAVRSVIQATGRGVRSADDHAVTYILDSQFTSNLWSKSRSMFPPWWREAVIFTKDIPKEKTQPHAE